jgi:GT2 family glycosyltransferase
MKVQIILLSHNRPEWILPAVRSVLDQNYSDFEVIVSENSSDERVATLLSKEFPALKVIKRRPFLSVGEHWNQILSEVKSPYFMLFHDDDVLLKDALLTLVSEMEIHPEVSAVAGNGQVIEGTTLTRRRFNASLKEPLWIRSSQQLGLHYLKSGMGVQPFPAYLYRKSAFEKVKFDLKEAGKYSDVTLLMKLAEIGPVLWLPNVHMHYRIHSSNDSNTLNIRSINALVRSYRRMAGAKAHDYWSCDFKVRNYALWLLAQGFSQVRARYPFRFRVIIKYVAFFLLKHPIRALQLVLGTQLKRLILSCRQWILAPKN